MKRSRSCYLELRSPYGKSSKRQSASRFPWARFSARRSNTPIFRRTYFSEERGKGEFFYATSGYEREEDARTFRALCGRRKIDRRRSNPATEETAYLCFSYKLNSAHVKYYRLLKATPCVRTYGMHVCDLSIFFCSMNTLWEFLSFSPLSLFLSSSSPTSLSRPALHG